MLLIRLLIYATAIPVSSVRLIPFSLIHSLQRKMFQAFNFTHQIEMIFLYALMTLLTQV